MRLNNPYVEEKRSLMIYLETHPDDEDTKKQLEAVEIRSREFTQNALDGLQTRIETIREQKTEVKHNHPSLSAQYKQMCAVYKEGCNLILDLRAAKKAIRDELVLKRTKVQE